MFNTKEELELLLCPDCESDWLEEIYNIDTKSYHIKCNSCEFVGEGSLVQREAIILWNKTTRYSEEIDSLEEELEAYKEELRSIVRRIDYLEDEKYYIEHDIVEKENEKIDIEIEIEKIKEKLKELKGENYND